LRIKAILVEMLAKVNEKKEFSKIIVRQKFYENGSKSNEKQPLSLLINTTMV